MAIYIYNISPKTWKFLEIIIGNILLEDWQYRLLLPLNSSMILHLQIFLFQQQSFLKEGYYNAIKRLD